VNDNLKKIVEEAKIGGAEFGNGVTYYVATEETFERFAQMLVDKCADLARENSQDRPYVADIIKKYFV